MPIVKDMQVRIKEGANLRNSEIVFHAMNLFRRDRVKNMHIRDIDNFNDKEYLSLIMLRHKLRKTLDYVYYDFETSKFNADKIIELTKQIEYRKYVRKKYLETKWTMYLP